MKLRDIKLETNVIETLFQELETLFQNLKKTRQPKLVPFKGGLSQLPLVVGLICRLPDSVNNLISKFVGFQSKPVKEIQQTIHRSSRYFETTNINKLFRPIFNAKEKRLHIFIWNQYIKLKTIKSLKTRQEVFIKLPQWLRKQIILQHRYTLLPQNERNRNFLIKQMHELQMI